MPSPLDRFTGNSAEDVNLDARADEASENLRALVSPEPYGIDDCDVTDVVEVNEGPDGEPVVVPVARFSLGRAEESPDLDVVWDLAYDAVRAMYPAFDAVFVRHYDVQFAFGGVACSTASRADGWPSPARSPTASSSKRAGTSVTSRTRCSTATTSTTRSPPSHGVCASTMTGDPTAAVVPEQPEQAGSDGSVLETAS